MARTFPQHKKPVWIQPSKTLDAQYKELENALSEFAASLPEEIRRSYLSGPRTWNSLSETIRTLKSQHNEKYSAGIVGRGKKRFHNLCETLESHSTALKLLPQGDKYTSVVTGSLEMITKASVNYVSIDEGFTRALEEISRIVGAIERELSLFREPFLEDLIAQLACKIVAFMTSSVKWYAQKSRKRFTMSFNEKLAPKYQQYVDEIKSISVMIQRGAQFCMAKSVSALPESFEEIRKMVVYSMQVQEHNQKEAWRRNEEHWEIFHRAHENWNNQMKHQGSTLFSNMSEQLRLICNDGIGRPMKEILDQEAISFVQDRRTSQEDREMQRMPKGPKQSRLDRAISPLGEDPQCPKIDIQEASLVLDQYFCYDNWLGEITEAQVFVEAEAVQGLQTWTAVPKSGFLGIVGPSSLTPDCPTHFLASRYVQAARSTGIPSISYFCEVSDANPPERRLRETIGSIAMLYGLMKQLILHLPQRLSQAQVTGLEAGFESLDGTLRTWREALSLFHDLLQLVEPPSLLCVIHGIESLEHEATTSALSSFMELLRRHVDPKATLPPNVFKVLISTAGVSHTVGSMMAETEIIDINRGTAASSPGRARPGRRDVESLEI